MRPPGSPRSSRPRRILAWVALASLGVAGHVAAQPSATIPPPHSWAVLGLQRGLPELLGARAGAPCDTGATIAPDRIRAAGPGVPAACLPNPGYETRAWCDLLDGPDPVLPTQVRPEDWTLADDFRGPASDPLGSARHIVRALEQAEARGTPGDSAVRARLDIVDTLLLQETRAHGAAAETRLLSARLQRLRRMRAWVPDTWAGPRDEGLRPALATVEEVLRAAPDDAMAHAWQAVLYDTRVPRFHDGHLKVAPLDREQALASLRRAIELAPSPAYATLLARWLAESDDFDGALEALRGHRGVDRRLVAVAEDLCRLPRFRELGFHALDDYSLTGWRGRLGKALRILGRDADHLEFRLRGWSWPDSAGGAEEALRRSWPDFRLFPVTGTAAAPGVRLYAQRVAAPRAAATPAAKRPTVSQDLDGGMSLVLVERPAPAGGRACCTLIVVDWRAPD